MQTMTIDEHLGHIESKVSPMFKAWTDGIQKEANALILEHIKAIREHIRAQDEVIAGFKADAAVRIMIREADNE